jgi:acetyl esterase/lipase
MAQFSSALLLLTLLVFQARSATSLPERAPQLIGPRVLRGLAYVPQGDSLQQLDLYLPPGSGFPTVLFLHGGSLTGGDKADEDYRGICNPFPKSGVACATMNYRLFPAVKWPAPEQDAAAAFRWLKSHIAEYGGSPARIFAFGHSSGCLLASLLGTDETYLLEQGLNLQSVAGVVAMGCRLNDKADFAGASQEQIRRHFTSDLYDAAFGSVEALNQAVPVVHVSAQMPPFLILIAEKEQVQPPLLDDSKVFVAAARQAGATADYVVLSGLSHYSAIRNAKSPTDPTFQRILTFVKKETFAPR